MSVPDNAYEVNLFEQRYKAPGSDERGWGDVFERVVNVVVNHAENIGVNVTGMKSEFLTAMAMALFVPGSPQLWNYGTKRRSARNGSSCYVGPMGDTLKEFRQADSDAEDVYTSSGGYGLNVSSVRPRGTKIKHCSEGAMGSMCEGGPALRIEGTTGYITGSGRARGALMLQIDDRHPDVLEFILAKSPSVLGWLDDWPTNAEAVLVASDAQVLSPFVHRFSTLFLKGKEWPTWEEAMDHMLHQDLDEAIGAKIVSLIDGRVVPMVTDWSTGQSREANRDWELPLQNCNMSVRFSDAFMSAKDTGGDWTFAWWSKDSVKDGELPWTKTDALGEGLREYDKAFDVDEDYSSVTESESCRARYAVIITTWEGLRANLAPNQNQWRDTKYARFYRTKILPAIGHLKGRIKAAQIWDLFCFNAWNHADPGAVFRDTYERFQPVDSSVYGERLSNPCSEYTNSPGGSCNLASVNLRACADPVDTSSLGRWPDWRDVGFHDEIHWTWLAKSPEFEAFLGNVKHAATLTARYIAMAMEHNECPVEFIDRMSREHFRTVGVGIMGLVEAMIKFHVKYGSKCAEGFAATVMSEVALAAWEESFRLAKVGLSTPKAWNGTKMTEIFLRREWLARDYKVADNHDVRWRDLSFRAAQGEVAAHTCVTSVAPTGTISMIASWVSSRLNEAKTTVTSGVEPPYSWGVGRKDNSGEDVTSHDMWANPEHRAKPWMVTAMDGVSPEAHIAVHGAVCAFCCMSVSKTVNLPKSATVHDISDAYTKSWSLGIPGTSVYRDQSKPMQVLTALECPSGECKIDWGTK
jgi:ribonucleotide reductase alpha subunit